MELMDRRRQWGRRDWHRATPERLEQLRLFAATAPTRSGQRASIRLHKRFHPIVAYKMAMGFVTQAA